MEKSSHSDVKMEPRVMWDVKCLPELEKTKKKKPKPKTKQKQKQSKNKKQTNKKPQTKNGITMRSTLKGLP